MRMITFYNKSINLTANDKDYSSSSNNQQTYYKYRSSSSSYNNSNNNKSNNNNDHYAEIYEDNLLNSTTNQKVINIS